MPYFAFRNFGAYLSCLNSGNFFNQEGGEILAKRLKDLLVFNGRPVEKDRTLFNGQLLDQRREDVFVVLHQMGVIR